MHTVGAKDSSPGPESADGLRPRECFGTACRLLTWILKGRKFKASVDLKDSTSQLGREEGNPIVVNEAFVGIKYKVMRKKPLGCNEAPKGASEL